MKSGLGRLSPVIRRRIAEHNALKRIKIDLKMKRTYEIEDGKLLDYYRFRGGYQ